MKLLLIYLLMSTAAAATAATSHADESKNNEKVIQQQLGVFKDEVSERLIFICIKIDFCIHSCYIYSIVLSMTEVAIIFILLSIRKTKST